MHKASHSLVILAEPCQALQTHLGKRQVWTRQGSMAAADRPRAAAGETWGRTANSLTPTKPPAAGRRQRGKKVNFGLPACCRAVGEPLKLWSMGSFMQEQEAGDAKGAELAQCTKPKLLAIYFSCHLNHCHTCHLSGWWRHRTSHWWQQHRQHFVGGAVERPKVGCPVRVTQPPAKGEEARQHLRQGRWPACSVCVTWISSIRVEGS